MKKMLSYLLMALFLAALIGFLGLHFIAPYAILQPPRVSADITPKRLGLSYQPLRIEVAQNIQLNGYWIQSTTETVRGIVIFVHGVGGCKEAYLHLSRKLARRGIESILIDNRAHGQSGGQFCTYGFYEKNDISKIIDFVKTKNSGVPIGIWGSSMGGAISILALEKDKRLAFGLIESTFTDLHQIVFDYKKRFLKGFGIRWLSDYGLKRAGEIANFDPFKVKPIEAVKQIDQPVFLAHGDADRNISYQYGQTLFDQLKSTDKVLELVKGGGHIGLMETGGKDFEEKVFAFINRQIAE